MSNPTPTITVTRKCEVVLAMSGLDEALTEILCSLRANDPGEIACCLATLVRLSTDQGSVSISGFSAEWRWDEERHLVVEMEVEGID